MKYGTSLSVLGVLLVALTHAQDLGKRITFVAPASRASVLFPQLAKATGFDWLTISQTENDVFLIQVHDVTIREIMDRIAKAANADWKKEGHSFRLVKPAILSRRAEAKELQQRAESLKSFLSILDEHAKGIPVWSAEQAKALADSLKKQLDASDRQITSPREYQETARKIEAQTPIEQAVRLLLEDIGPQELADLEPGRRTVFALRPTSMQLPFGNNAAKIIDQFATSQRQYAQAFAELGPRTNTPAAREFGELPVVDSGDPTLGIGQAVLILTRNDLGFRSTSVHFRATVIVADTKGQTLASGDSSPFEVMPDPQEDAKPDDSNPFSLSSKAQRFAKAAAEVNPNAGLTEMPRVRSFVKGLADPVTFSTFVNMGLHHAPIESDMRAELLTPETADPLSLFVGEALSDAASALKLNLVADLPDASFGRMSRFFNESDKPVGASDFFKIQCPNFGLAVQTSTDWVTISPSEPIEAEGQRVNRAGLGHLLRSIDQKKILDLDDLAAFAVSEEKTVNPLDLDYWYLSTIGGSMGGKAAASLRTPYTLRIYATLTPTERSALAASGSIPLEALTQDQKHWLSEDVFYSFDGPNIRISSPPNAALPGASPRPIRNRSFGPDLSLATERTQALPNGIPSNGVLNFKLTSSAGFYGHNVEHDVLAFLTAADLAAREFQNEKPELGKPLIYDTFQPASKSSVALKYDLAEGVSLSRTLENVKLNLASMPLAYQDLSDDTKKQIADILQLIRESPIATARILGPNTLRRTPPP